MAQHNRADIDKRYTWDLESIFPTEDAFIEAFENAKSYPEAYRSYQGKISQSANDLLAFLRMQTLRWASWLTTLSAKATKTRVCHTIRIYPVRL